MVYNHKTYMKEYNKKYDADPMHKEAKRLRNKKWRLAHKEEIRIKRRKSDKKYAKTHKRIWTPAQRERIKQYQLAHKPEIKIQKHNYYLKHKHHKNGIVKSIKQLFKKLGF